MGPGSGGCDEANSGRCARLLVNLPTANMQPKVSRSEPRQPGPTRILLSPVPRLRQFPMGSDLAEVQAPDGLRWPSGIADKRR
jgi:hypothetical protein